MYKGSTYRNMHKHVKNHIHKHIGKHVLKHAHKASHHANKTHHAILHVGELILVGSIGFMSLMFAGSSNLPNNSSFSYPLQKVSTVECRTLYRNDMPDSCKINLPIIHGANYEAYENNSIYRSIYTALRAAPYSDSWNQKIGAHAGLDIATARGTPLYSIGDGEVYFAGRNSAYGNVVKIKYVYNGEIVYAVYAHMDSMDIKAGDKVSKGQRIGAVGNSGNTSGKLGGYHVHFEIDKDNYGRPAYSYTNCPDLSKGHYKIIQNGLCRMELFTYQYDPIKIFEANSTYIDPALPENEDNSLDDQSTQANDQEDDAQTDTGINLIDLIPDDTDIVDQESDANNYDNDTEIEKWNEVIEDNIQDDHNSADDNNQEVIPSDDIVVEENIIVGDNTQTETSIDLIVETQQEEIITEVETDIIENIEAIEELDKEDPLLIELKFDGISLLAEHFLNLWDIEMHSELKESSLMLGETLTLDIEIFKKGEENNRNYNRFNGVLQVPFMFITSNNSIDIDVNYLQLITKGKAKIEITGKEIGESHLIVEFGGKKIGVLDITIK